MKNKGTYKCGCQVGTHSIWRDSKGRVTTAGSLNAEPVQCSECKKTTKIRPDLNQ